MRPASATVFSSSTSERSTPGSPRRANPGARRRGEASAALPSPPRPPCAATNLVPAPTRSASTSPSSVFITVPSGTRTTRSPPAAPLRLEPDPCLPLPARRTGRRWRSSRVAVPGSTSRITSPPRPPFPPSGPPSGLNFSRRTEAQPCPPSPAFTRRATWSANSATASFLPGGRARHGPGRLAPKRVRGGPAAGPPLTLSLDATLLGRHLGSRFGDDAHGPPATYATERHHPTDECEQGVIPAAAHSGAGVEVGAALADKDLAGVDTLATEPLHAQPLCRGVAPVAAGRSAFLVCHRQLFFPAAVPAFGAALLPAAVVLPAAAFGGLVFPAPVFPALAFAGPAFAGAAFAVLAFAVLDLAVPLFPVEIPVIFTWVYRWRWPSRR